jgi:DNA replication protein DnaC
MVQTEIQNKNCPICGKPYIIKNIKILGENRQMQIAGCECEENERQKITQEKEIQTKLELRKRKTEELKASLNCPLVTPFFKDKTFEKIQKISGLDNYNKMYDYCVKFSKEFNSKTTSGMLMFGNVGSGKTTLQACICNELTSRGKNCLLISFSALLDELYEVSNYEVKNKSITKTLNALTQFDYIVIDDLGREKYTEKRLENAFKIFDTLYNYKVCTSITANKECLQKIFNIPEFNAIADRINDICPIRLIFDNTTFRGSNCKEI